MRVSDPFESATELKRQVRLRRLQGAYQTFYNHEEIDNLFLKLIVNPQALDITPPEMMHIDSQISCFDQAYWSILIHQAPLITLEDKQKLEVWLTQEAVLWQWRTAMHNFKQLYPAFDYPFLNVTQVEIWENKLTTFNGIGLPNLKNLQLCSNPLVALDISFNILLTDLYISQSFLTHLKLSKNTALKILILQANNLCHLNLSKNASLEILNLFMNNLCYLDLSNNKLLHHLEIRENSLLALDLSAKPLLTELTLSADLITSLNVSPIILLSKLKLACKNLIDIDISKNVNLTSFSLAKSKITYVDISKNLLLNSIEFSGNKITYLDISCNTLLRDLTIEELVTSLEISNNLALVSVYLCNTHLSILNVSSNLYLTYYKLTTDTEYNNYQPITNRIISINKLGRTNLWVTY